MLKLPAGLLPVVKQVLSAPVAPFAEEWVSRRVEALLAGRVRLRAERDAAGNLLFRYRPRGTRAAKFALQSHLDHPGFIAEGAAEAGRCRCRAYGWVPHNLKGATLRLFEGPNDRGQAARVVAVETNAAGRPEAAIVKTARAVAPGAVGMFDFPPLRRAGAALECRAIDATFGAGVLAWLLREACARRFPQPFDVVLTRAEEAGCVGALELARRGTARLPETIVTLEFPNAIGEIALGGGAINRIGDAACIFDPRLAAHLDELSFRLAAEKPGFKMQRRLGWRGRTEASIFAHHGHRTACVCLPNANYHNIGPGGRPRPERADLGDLASLCALLRELVVAPFAPERSWRARHRRVEKRGAALARRLYCSAG